MPDALSLEEQVIAALRRITRAIDLHSRLLLQTNGLTIPQLVALQAIQRLQPITVGGDSQGYSPQRGNRNRYPEADGKAWPCEPDTR